MKFSINTLGCKVNLCESDEISSILSGYGFRKVDYITGNPNLCIINTCTVTSESDRKVRQLVRRIRKINKAAKLVITGCYVKDNYDFLKDNGADLIIHNEKKKDIDSLVGSILEIMGKDRQQSVFCGDHAEMHSRPIVKIQDGCEQNCSYCIIPSVRGGYRSTAQDVVLKKIERLSGDGYEEVVLTGIHIGKYGLDMENKSGLACLLDEIFSKTDIGRIRISSLEINEINDDIIDIIEKYHRRLAPHLHIPLQSGGDRILKSMGRPYDSRYFIKILKILRKIFPGITITTDIMVGFPGEMDSDFNRTLDIVKKARFSKLHVFKYSERHGTRASLLENRVEANLKNERSMILRKLGNVLREDFLKANIDAELFVAVEAKNKESGILSGTSGNYIKVYFKTDLDPDRLRGKIIRVRARKLYRKGLAGDVL